MRQQFLRITLISIGFVVLTGLLCAQPPVRSRVGTPERRVAKKPSPKPAVLPATATGPLQQVPMGDLPAAAPKVTYQGGMLTIAAQNATLGDILREVHKQTGATIDVPANANERVATHIGPGPARDVLAELLNGSSFNYVIVGTPANPAELANVVLSPKPARVENQTVAYQPAQQYVPPQPVQMAPGPGMGPGGQVAEASDEESDATEDEADMNSEEQDQETSSENAVSPDGTQPPNGGPRTPEQILEMLRQRQQQSPPGSLPIQRQPNPLQQPQAPEQ